MTISELIQTVYIKIKFPKLEVVKLSNYGVFSENGLDLYIYSILFNIISNDSNNSLVEISRPSSFNISCFNLFLPIFPNKNFLLFGDEMFISKNCNSFNSAQVLNNSSSFIFPPYLKYGDILKIECDKFKLVKDNTDVISILAFCFDSSELNGILDIVYDKKVYSLLVYNNPLIDKQSKLFRNKLISLGYVFYARIDSSHDFFILSDCVNGFPSECFRNMPLSSLTKWISVPNNSNFTKPL